VTYTIHSADLTIVVPVLKLLAAHGLAFIASTRPPAYTQCILLKPCARLGSVMNILNKIPSITSRTMSGYFNDMDGLEVGNGGQDDNEYVTHFSTWAINSSPLMIGTNIATLSPQSLSILSNPPIIALNQDPSAGAAVRKWRYLVDPDDYGQGEIALWSRTLKKRRYCHCASQCWKFETLQ
jgi:alpha-galactosidase